MDPKLVEILERALGLPKGIVERDAEWANAKPGDPPWPAGRLAEEYLLAGMDRRALLRRVGLVADDAPSRELRP